MLELTKTQRRVYVFLKRRWQMRGSQPNLHDLARDLDIHYVSLRQHLDALASKNYLAIKSQGRGKQPIIRLVSDENPDGYPGVPLVGEIAAGGLIGNVEHLEGYLRLPEKPGRFALRVKGDSMSELIRDRDIVILKPGTPEGGEVCAVRYEDETTLKYLDLYQDGGALLRPHNPDYDPIEVNLEDIHVAGLYVGHMSASLAEELFLDVA